MVRINGESMACDGMTIGAYLEQMQYDRVRIAIERNGDIVPKAEYDTVVLQDGDVLEIVRFVGGG